MGGLDTLTALEVLSVGNNLIGDLSSVLYLRPFKRLHAVNFAGNPLCQGMLTTCVLLLFGRLAISLHMWDMPYIHQYVWDE